MRKLLTMIVAVFVACLATGLVFAETGEATGSVSFGSSLAFGAAIIMAAASGLGTLAQSRAAAAALSGIARNPQSVDKVQTPLILSLALMESLVIFAFVIAILLYTKM